MRGSQFARPETAAAERIAQRRSEAASREHARATSPAVVLAHAARGEAPSAPGAPRGAAGGLDGDVNALADHALPPRAGAVPHASQTYRTTFHDGVCGHENNSLLCRKQRVPGLRASEPTRARLCSGFGP